MLKDLLFDLDDTIVSLNNSREKVVLDIFKNYLNKDFDILSVRQLIKENKQKDYVDTINVILKKFGCIVDAEKLVNEFSLNYLTIAKDTEELIVDDSTLNYLKSKYNLYIVTDRPRLFYDGIWKDKLSIYFNDAICHDDFKDIQRKPSPDIINKTIERFNLDTEYYVGNDIKDILAAHSANLKSIFVKHTNKNSEEIEKYKPEIILDNINDLINVIL